LSGCKFEFLPANQPSVDLQQADGYFASAGRSKPDVNAVTAAKNVDVSRCFCRLHDSRWNVGFASGERNRVGKKGFTRRVEDAKEYRIGIFSYRSRKVPANGVLRRSSNRKQEHLEYENGNSQQHGQPTFGWTNLIKSVETGCGDF
jgi:hypothetical protein